MTEADLLHESQFKRGEDSYVTALNNTRIDLENSQKEITRLETIIGIRNILKMKGWDEFDCSNHVSCTDKYWRNFIGTLDEFKKFMKENFNEDYED